MTPLESSPAPAIPADPAWDEALLRVESYLGAFGLESRVLVAQIASEIIREARSLALSGSTGEPVGLALRVTYSRIGEWFARAGQANDWKDGRIHAQGRLALILADLPGRWANHFLGAGPVPDDLARAMAAGRILPGPEVHFSNMAPEPLEFALLEPGGPRFPTRRFWVPVRSAISWLLIFGFFGVAWAASH